MLPLHTVVSKHRDVEVVRVLLKAYPEAAGIHCCGQLPLHLAAIYNSSLDVVKVLLEANPSAVSEPNNAGDVPLHLAIVHQASDKLIDALLEIDSRVAGSLTNKGELPLHLAALHNASVHVVTALLSACPGAANTPSVGDPPNDLPLHIAITQHASVEVVRMLLDATPHTAGTPDNEGDLPLHLAITHESNPDVFTLLLDVHPPACSKPNKAGELPLHTAARHNTDTKLFSVLLATYPGAAAVLDKQHELPLHKALACSARRAWCTMVVRTLLEAHPDAASVPFSNGVLPLHLALKNQFGSEVTIPLLQAYTDAASITESNRSYGVLPLHLAVIYKSTLEVVTALLAVNPGAASTLDDARELPLHHAIRQGASAGVIAALLQAHPDAVLAYNVDGYTPSQAAGVCCTGTTPQQMFAPEVQDVLTQTATTLLTQNAKDVALREAARAEAEEELLALYEEAPAKAPATSSTKKKKTKKKSKSCKKVDAAPIGIIAEGGVAAVHEEGALRQPPKLPTKLEEDTKLLAPHGANTTAGLKAANKALEIAMQGTGVEGLAAAISTAEGNADESLLEQARGLRRQLKDKERKRRRRRDRQSQCVAALEDAVGAAVVDLQVLAGVVEQAERLFEKGSTGEQGELIRMAKVKLEAAKLEHEESQKAASLEALAKEFEALRRSRGLDGTDVLAQTEPDLEVDSIMCVVCLSNPKEIAFGPCGHLCACCGCAEAVQLQHPKLCPLCRGVIENTMRIYF